MAKRKLNIPKAKQIKGLRKAIANRRTPRQFLPSLRKRLAKLTAVVAILFALCGCAARPAVAQTPVIIQPTQQPLATGASCTGTAQTYPVNNKNQTTHLASLVGGPFTKLAIEIDGIDIAGNVFRISDVGLTGQNSSGVIISGNGYYPTVQIQVTCTGSGTYTLSYSGSSAAQNPTSGLVLGSQVDKQLITSGAANANQGNVFQTPFGNSSGTLVFTYGTTGPSGSTLQVQCESVTGSGGGLNDGIVYTFPLATTATIYQLFNVPPTACPEVTVSYVSGGASAALFNSEYLFNPFGAPVNTTLSQYLHVTGTSATAVKGTQGSLIDLTVNTPAAGTISIFDLATAACTGTPSTNTIAVITATATAPFTTFEYNHFVLNGICVKASAAMDFTVGYQ